MMKNLIKVKNDDAQPNQESESFSCKGLDQILFSGNIIQLFPGYLWLADCKFDW